MKCQYSCSSGFKSNVRQNKITCIDGQWIDIDKVRERTDTNYRPQDIPEIDTFLCTGGVSVLRLVLPECAARSCALR